MTHTYSSYLCLDGLLSQQVPASAPAEHDEWLFIAIHQVYELWFKQLLLEFDRLRVLMEEGRVAPATHTLGRILKIWKLLVAQIDVLETMTPLEFLSFRERLDSASGFQSCQFRELEAVLGFRKEQALAAFPEGGAERARLERRMQEPTLWQTFLACLRKAGVALPAAEHGEELEEVLIDVYRTQPQLAALAERLVDIDEGVQEWRYRHVKMVERTIGAKLGTGGSSGVGYLASTLMQPAFPALWAIRARF